MSLGIATRSEPGDLLAPGRQPVPGYRLGRRLGAGGSGEVWEATGPGGFPVALKVVPLGGPRTAAHLHALEIARVVRHPNLLANFGAWIDDDRLIMAMELADGSLWGRFLEARAAGRPGIPRGALADALAEAARGVDFLNEPRHALEGRSGLGIQHRDLKPQNILIVGGGVKVADFGAARWMDGPVVGQAGGQWTPAYAPPEFLLGATARQSDQYSLAVTYCHLRTGRLPFPAEPAAAGGPFLREPDLSALDDDERPAVARALSRDPDDRWPTCRAFVDALRGVVPALPAPPPARSPGRRVAPASLVWPNRVVTSLAEAPPALTYITGDARPHDPADDSAWDGPMPSEYETIDAPTPVGPGSIAADPRRRRRRLLTAASLVAAVGLAAWFGGSALAPARPPALAERPASAARIAHRVARPVLPAEPQPDPAPAPEPPAPAPEPAGPPASLARKEAPPATPSVPAPSSPTAPAPAVATTRPEAGPAARRSLARLVLAMIANPTLSPQFEALAKAPAPEAPAATTAPRRPAPEPPPAPEADELADAPASGPGRATAPAPVSRPDEPARPRAESHIARGEAFFKAGDFALARIEFDAALALRPDSAAAMSDRGLCWMGEGDLLRAIADIDAALKLAPGSAVIHYNRGVAYARLGDSAEARASYDEALRLDPALTFARAARDLLPNRPVALSRAGSPAPPPPARPTLAGTGR